MRVLYSFCYFVEVSDVSHPVVELEKAETTSTSQNSRTTASSPLRYSGPVIRFLAPFLVSFSS